MEFDGEGKGKREKGKGIAAAALSFPMLYLYSSVLEMKGGLRRDAIIGVQILTMQPVDANYGVPTMGLNAAAVAPLFPFPFSLLVKYQFVIPPNSLS